MNDQARQHASLAVKAHEEGRWQDALRHAHACRELAPAGSMLAAWSLHFLACTYVDLGRLGEARAFGLAYLHEAPNFPQLDRYTPFVTRVLGLAAYHARRFSVAATLFRDAASMFFALGNTEQAERSQLAQVWALVRMGRLVDARSILLATQRDSHLWDGAHCALLASEGRMQEAIVAGEAALQGARLAHDYSDAAEVALILAQALRALGQAEEASAYIEQAATFAARQQQDAYALLMLSNRAGGGDPLAQAAARGSANPSDRGCFTTGIA